MSAYTGKVLQGGTNFSATGVQFNQDFNLMSDGQAQAPHKEEDKQVSERDEEYSGSESSDGSDMKLPSEESELFFMEHYTER